MSKIAGILNINRNNIPDNLLYTKEAGDLTTQKQHRGSSGLGENRQNLSRKHQFDTATGQRQSKCGERNRNVFPQSNTGSASSEHFRDGRFQHQRQRF